MTIDQRRFSGLMLKAVLVALILTPPIKVIPGVPAIRVDEVLLVVWGVLSITLWRGRDVSTYVPMLLPLTMFFALIPLSILNGMWHGFAVSLGDLNQIIRLIKYTLVLFLAWKVIAGASIDYLASFFRLTLILLLVISLVTLAQHFNFLGINSFLIPYVATEKYFDLMLNEGSMRPVGFVGNPNALGFQICFLLLGSMYLCIYRGYKSSLFAISVALGFFAILATLSRTALLAFLLASICMFGSAAAGAFLSMKVSKKTMMMSAALVMLFAGMFVAFFTSEFLYDRILWRFVGGVSVQSDTSFQARLSNWRESYEVIQTVPILGAGPLRRADFEFAADNEYLLVLRSYGVIGLLLIFLFYFYSIYKVRDGGARLNVPVVAAVLIMMLPASVFFDAAVFPLVVILLVVGRAYKRHTIIGESGGRQVGGLYR